MPNIDAILLAECTRLGLEESYIRAIIEVESGGNQWKTRYESGFNYFENPQFWAAKTGVSLDTEMAGQKTSWSLMQVMGGTARGLGFSGLFPELCILDVGLHFGCLLFSQKLLKFKTYPDAIAAYNAGHPVLVDGKYKNQDYVDKVMAARVKFI